jgi:hypothetical protein
VIDGISIGEGGARWSSSFASPLSRVRRFLGKKEHHTKEKPFCQIENSDQAGRWQGLVIREGRGSEF